MLDEIWVGRFEWEGSCVRINEQVNRGTPVVAIPLTWNVIQGCLEACMVPVQWDDGQPNLPAGWAACYDLGFLTFNRDEVRQDALCAIRCLVEKHGCEIVYAQSGSSFTVREVEEYARWLEAEAAAKLRARPEGSWGS